MDNVGNEIIRVLALSIDLRIGISRYASKTGE